MNNSYASLSFIKPSENKARPHLNKGLGLVEVEPELWDPSKKNGAAGGIYSNVHDLSQWLLLHLNKGKYGPNLSQELFSEENQKEMWKIHTTLNANPNPRYNSHFRGYGLGWFLNDAQGCMVVSHTGGLIGMLSKTVLVPDLNLGIVVLTNTYLQGAGAFSAISQSILDHYWELEPVNWASIYAKEMQGKNEKALNFVEDVWKESKSANRPSINFENYTGTYKDPWFGEVSITKQGEKLYFKSKRSKKLEGSMHFYKANTWLVDWKTDALEEADAFVMFRLDENGKAQGIQMKGISPIIDFSFDFQDLNLERMANP